MRKIFFAGIATLLIVVAAAAHSQTPGQPTAPSTLETLEGSYAVKGWNPGVATTGNPSYTGTAGIKKIGDTYQVDWRIGNSTYGGVGLFDPATGVLRFVEPY